MDGRRGWWREGGDGGGKEGGCTDCFFLLLKRRDQLKATCDFIATTWAKAWFSNQHYLEGIYNELHAAVSKLKCPKALRYFSTHWIKERSVLDVPR